MRILVNSACRNIHDIEIQGMDIVIGVNELVGKYPEAESQINMKKLSAEDE